MLQSGDGGVLERYSCVERRAPRSPIKPHDKGIGCISWMKEPKHEFTLPISILIRNKTSIHGAVKLSKSWLNIFESLDKVFRSMGKGLNYVE
jgi:hypothetical protein